RAEVLLTLAGDVGLRVGGPGMLDRLNRAEVLHVVGEEIGAHASAQGEPRKETQVRICVEPYVVEVGVQVRVGEIRRSGCRLDALLQSRGDVVPREVAELDLLQLIEPLLREACRAPGTDR